MAPALDQIYIGTAGWNISRHNLDFFPLNDLSHLERYSRTFSAVEINTSFYRHHKAATYQRWAQSVPENFRFSVKLTKEFTHQQKLRVELGALQEVLSPILELGVKMGVLLVQLPPQLSFEKNTAEDFFGKIRLLSNVPVACEPRHGSWVSPIAAEIFRKYGISKVNADPEPCLDPENLFEHRFLEYFRLHGSPVTYWSRYPRNYLHKLANEIIAAKTSKAWVFFDNTAAYYAVPNAWELQELAQAKRKAG